jgi:hypothetical protein
MVSGGTVRVTHRRLQFQVGFEPNIELDSIVQFVGGAATHTRCDYGQTDRPLSIPYAPWKVAMTSDLAPCLTNPPIGGTMRLRLAELLTSSPRTPWA